MYIEIITLLVGLFFAIKGADVLVASSVSIGKKLSVSDFFIGLVIIGFGTSISELLVSVDAVLNNSANLSVGNILGSNIANILLVFSTVGFIKKIQINRISLFDILFHTAVHIVFFLIFNFSKFEKNFGALFILLFLFYIIYSYFLSKKKSQVSSEVEKDIFSQLSFKRPSLFGFPIIILSIFITLCGVDLAVQSAINISNKLYVPDSFIGLSIIAIGTSLPELVTSIAAAKKGKDQIIVGNIIGSNIYNLLFILGITSLFELFEYNFSVLSPDVLILTLLVFFFSLIVLKRVTISYKLSFLCLILYIIYLSNLFIRNF